MQAGAKCFSLTIVKSQSPPISYSSSGSSLVCQKTPHKRVQYFVKKDNVNGSAIRVEYIGCVVSVLVCS